MGISASDIKHQKPATITDTAANGGVRTHNEFQSRVKHAIFPRVSSTERQVGVERYRKAFWSNMNAADNAASDLLMWLEMVSTGDDRMAIGASTQREIQSAMEASPPVWVGPGQLNTALSGGETAVSFLMETNEPEFINNGYVHISNKFMVSQTVDADVNVGDSVTYSGGTWSYIAAQSDIVYPDGVYMGGNIVLTYTTGTSKEEWLQVADYTYTDEDIGTGNGSSTAPALTTLTNITNGLVTTDPDLLPVITATCGSTTRTVNVAADGSCSGYCSAGTLNMTTGVWDTDITWTTAPDNATDILADYAQKVYAYSSNVCTVQLAEAVANAYATANTYGSGCLYTALVQASYDSLVLTSSAGTYDSTNYPPVLHTDGAEEDDITLTFSSSSAFTASGLYAGDLGAGTTGSDFSPTNSDTGQPLVTIPSAAWGGTLASGDTLTLTTHPAAHPYWWMQDVPEAAADISGNQSILGWLAD